MTGKVQLIDFGYESKSTFLRSKTQGSNYVGFTTFPPSIYGSFSQFPDPLIKELCY